jgi:hypothetical protein
MQINIIYNQKYAHIRVFIRQFAVAEFLQFSAKILRIFAAANLQKFQMKKTTFPIEC